MCDCAKECIACSRVLQKLYSLSFIFYILTGTSGKCTNGFEKTVIVRLVPNYPATLCCMHFTALCFLCHSGLEKLLNKGGKVSRDGRFEEIKKKVKHLI